jgi:hypothetical protein
VEGPWWTSNPREFHGDTGASAYATSGPSPVSPNSSVWPYFSYETHIMIADFLARDFGS